MIEVKDRIPTYPGRVKLIPVEGQPFTYDMVRSDEPIEVGTPINKVLFDSITADMVALKKTINDAIFAITQRVALSSVAVGGEIGLYENGVLVPFILLAKNFESSGRNLVIRKNCFSLDTMMAQGDDFYENCKIDRWLNEEYLTYLDGATQTYITAITIKSGDAYGFKDLSRKAFLLSTAEYGLVPISSRYEGSTIPYFSANAERRISRYDGTPVVHYTRTVDSSVGVNDTNAVTEKGEAVHITNPNTRRCGIRPAFTLPNSLQVTLGVPSTANTVATAEVI
jgi:hypothetical protein